MQKISANILILIQIIYYIVEFIYLARLEITYTKN